MPSLRRYGMAADLVDAFRIAATGGGTAAQRRRTFRVVHFSLQPDHVHLIVEATSKASLGRGLQSLVSRLARRVNGKLRRRGKVFADRYFGRALPTPSEVRNAVVYVLTNAAKHAEPIPDPGTEPVDGLDPCSSGFWFTGWRRPPPPQLRAAPVAAPTTWLLREGWTRHGLVRRNEHPAALR